MNHSATTHRRHTPKNDQHPKRNASSNLYPILYQHYQLKQKHSKKRTQLFLLAVLTLILLMALCPFPTTPTQPSSQQTIVYTSLFQTVLTSLSSLYDTPTPTLNILDIPLLHNYDSWRQLTLHLVSLPPSQILTTLHTYDPYGVRTFDRQLKHLEQTSNHTITIKDLRTIFPCPPNGQRISLPERFNHSTAHSFQTNDKSHDTFLFFQHLRKAGGTQFCTLAQDNIPASHVPPYYCMPDMNWSGGKSAGYLHHYTNAQIVTFMRDQQWKIAGNEWDNFRVDNPHESHFHLPAVFATSFRTPLDRALSQFRFECIEDRGCVMRNVTKWWKRREDLWNVYTTTLADQKLYGLTDSYMESDGRRRQEIVESALDTLSRFHVVLVLEWLSYAGPLLEDMLGWKKLTVITKRVRPHAVGTRRREDGGKGESWVAEEYLDNSTYKVMSESLAVDEVLFDVARRFFLERLVCMPGQLLRGG